LKKQSRLIRAIKGITPRPIRSAIGSTFWWLWESDDAWEGLWRQYLDTLEKGGSLEPDPGLVGDKEYLTKQIIGRYGSLKGTKILGAGCGTGRIEAWLAQEGAEVVCLDHFVEALQVSRIHAQRSEATGHFVVGNLVKMPFKDKTFDCIYSGGVLEHFEDLASPLGEYFRVTKPKGLIVVSVPNLVGHNAMYGIKPLTEMVVRKRMKRGSIEQDFSAGRLRRAIQDAGFECLDISPTFFNAFDHSPFKYMRAVLSAIGLYRPWCKLLDAFGRRFPGIAFGYSFMIALGQRPET
jgi:2-polyprenyl-3-methyl-5-hydroxy-6-metoxy-1,4-benzoquinol methylase